MVKNVFLEIGANGNSEKSQGVNIYPERSGEDKMNFVTIFNMRNVHVTKDVGLIPYGMYKYHKYDAYCASYNNGPYTAIDTECEGLEMWYIEKLIGNFDIDAVIFLIKNAKKIDVMNVYHIRLATALKIFIYRWVNPRGKIYWKMDGGADVTDKSNYFRRCIYQWAMRKCCLLSSEISVYVEKLNKDWSGAGKFVCIPNPYNPNTDIAFLPYTKRENVILTVGRLGTEQKATEVLMDAFRYAVNNMGLKGWKLELIGSIEKKNVDFEKYIADWYEENPNMISLVSFVGEVNDRDELNKEYRMAKIFAFPSRYESYGIAVVEAIINGCFIVATDIPSNREITENFRYSASFPVDDIQRLAEQLIIWCKDDVSMENNAKKLYECVMRNNSLYEICKTINTGIQC